MSKEDESLKDQLIVIKFREFLEEGKSEDATQLFSQAEAEGVVSRCLWDIVPILSLRLNKKNKITQRSVFESCEKNLFAVAQKCNPRETLLLILEQAKDVEDEETFRTLLKPLRECLIRSGISKGIDWCAGSIKNYTKLLAQPENQKPEEKEDPEEVDIVEERLIKDYEAILDFLEPLTSASALGKTEETKARNYLLSLHLFLFGNPFCYSNSPKIASLFQSSLTQMSLLTGDLLKFHGIIRDRSLKRRREKYESEEDEEDLLNIQANLFRSEENVSDLAYANYYYYLLTSEEGQKNIAQVYNPHYLIHSCFYLSNIMLKQPEYILVSKGLSIAESILEKIEKSSISHEILEFSIYHDLFASLAQVMIYCDADKLRKMALQVFRNYVDSFNIRARYLVLLNLYETSNHSGLMSLLTNITKASIIYCLDNNCDYFLGGKLERLIKRICKLPAGSASDLVEISDEIIAALNLLRFLTIRDKDNTTGIWKMMDYLERDYLKPLREGIDISRAHWKVKVKDLEEQKKKNIDCSAKTNERREMETLDQEITVSVGGQNLPMMPATEKIKFCLQAINALDIMESIVIRLNECIEENPLRKNCVRSLWTSRALLANQAGQTAEHGAEKTHENPASTESDEEYEKNIKTKILSASLNYVNEFGWSQQAISAGAESVGYPGIIHGMFPRGGAELVQHFYASCNAELNKILKAEALAIEANPEAGTKKSPEAQVRDALEKRLRMIIPYKSTWPQAIGLMTLPPNVPTSLANLLTLVDDICYYAGDRSVDFNWYTRRVVLAGIYKTTELYLLQDSSEDNKKTWEFMERRIEDAVQLNRVISVTSDLPPPDQALSRATEAASAAFITARNILGLNWNR